MGRCLVLNFEEENDLAEHCRLKERKIFGLPLADVMHLANLLATRNGIRTLFCKRNEENVRKWLKSFLNGNQESSVTNPEVLHSQARGDSLLNQWLSIFKSKNSLCTVQYTIQHNPARLYNSDDTCLTVVQHKHTKIFGLKCKRQISSVQTA